MKPFIFLCVFLFANFAHAQGMPNPEQMAGKPRQDAGIPKGAVRVRVIQDDLSHNVQGAMVMLKQVPSQDQPPYAEQAAPTDAQGRYLFQNVPPGTYQIVAKFGQKMTQSDFIPVIPQQEAGTALLLMFHSAPLQWGVQSALAIDIAENTTRVVLNVAEVLVLHNTTADSIDPGPMGLRIPLPKEAHTINPLNDFPKEITFDATGQEPFLVWHGPISAGKHNITFHFEVPIASTTYRFHQRVTLPWKSPTVYFTKRAGISFQGTAFQKQLEDHGFRPDVPLIKETGPNQEPGSALEFHLEHLPLPSQSLPWGAGIAGAIVFLSFVAGWYFLVRHKPALRTDEAGLLVKRDELFAELLQIELSSLPSEQIAQQQHRVRTQLEAIYHQLQLHRTQTS